MSQKSTGRTKASRNSVAPPKSAGHVCSMNTSIKHIFLCVCVLLFALAVFTGCGAAEQTVVPDQLLVKFVPDYPYAETETVIEDHSDLVPGLVLIKTPDGMSVDEAVAYYSSLSYVIYAEPNYCYSLPEPVEPEELTVSSLSAAGDVMSSVFDSDSRIASSVPVKRPNDEYYFFSDSYGNIYSRQYGLENIGKVIYSYWVVPDTKFFGNAVSGADISAPEAWAITTGSKDVVVAVLDTGVNYNHNDIKANMWTDSKGHHGYDFVNNDAYPMDDEGHGTHVAGIIGAVGNNGIGISGVAWNVSIMAVKVLDNTGWGTVNDEIEGIHYASDNNADIINMSFGGYYPPSRAQLDAIQNSKAVVVCAAGNEWNDNDISPHYPSSYTAPNIIAVAATDQWDELANRGTGPGLIRDGWGSNYGKKSVDVAAPGVDILSLSPIENNYYFNEGTSMAAPFVSGVAALVLSVNPNLTNTEVISIIKETVDKLDSLSGKVATGGRVNAYNAVKAAAARDVKVTGLEISGEPSVLIGATTQLTAVVKPENATNKEVTWKSSKTSVATVDSTGKVKGIKEGSATITATSKENSKIKDTFTITVTSNDVKVTGLEISGESSVLIGATTQLTAEVKPENATNKEVTWKSSKTSVATVDSTGKVKGIKEGSATITATSKENSKIKDTFTITVTSNEVKVTGLEISGESSVLIGATTQLTAEVKPENATNKEVTWKSSKTSVATVDSTGKVKGIKEGSATITATSKENSKIKDTFTITVTSNEVKVTGLEISGESSVLIGATTQLTAEVKPENATNKEVTWKSSKTSVATVDSTGKVKGIKEGSATITATSKENSKIKDTFTITVTSNEVKVTDIEISGESSVLIGATTQLTAEVKPENATNKEVTWKSSKTSVATVDSTGKVKGVKAGTATITATSKENSKIKDTFTITVTSNEVKVTSLEISGESSVLIGDTTQLTAEVKPENATNKEVTWKSSKTSVATVDSTGKVKGVKVGTATITATSKDNSKVKDTFTITVTSNEVKVTDIEISGESSVLIGDTTQLTAEVKPENATNKEVTWKSSKTSVATVDSTGKVKGIKEGSAKITATSKDNSKIKDTFTITVTSNEVKVTDIEISGESSVLIGDTTQLTAVVKPENATNTEVTWKSSKTSVATVDSTGNVKGIKEGTAKITATSKGNSKIKDTFTITVTSNEVKVTDIEISGETSVLIGDTTQLTAVVKPENATNTEVTWKSSKTSVATVDSTGKVKGIKEGSAKITATAKDGSKVYGTVMINVTK